MSAKRPGRERRGEWRRGRRSWEEFDTNIPEIGSQPEISLNLDKVCLCANIGEADVAEKPFSATASGAMEAASEQVGVKAPSNSSPWKMVKTEDGDTYYHNEETDETAWDVVDES